MTYAIESAILACSGMEYDKWERGSHRAAIASDFILVVSSVALGVLLLSGAIAMPGNLATIGFGVSTGLGAGIALADLIAAGGQYLSARAAQNSVAEQRGALLKPASQAELTEEEVKKSQNAPCHEIAKGLFLGNNVAFAQALSRDSFTTSTSEGQTQWESTNPLNLTTVITLCPLETIQADIDGLNNHKAKDFKAQFEVNNVTWHFVGKMAVDDESYWESLAFDCTYMWHQMAQKTLPLEEEEFNTMVQAKKASMNVTPIAHWFAPLFAEMEQAEAGKKRVLIHCEVGNQSLTVAVVAAYLINRYHLTSEKALDLLKSKGACVNTKFANKLKEYELALAAERLGLKQR